MSAYEQQHLLSSINFAIHNTKLCALTAETIKNDFKGIIERFVASENKFLVMSSVKRTPEFRKQDFYYVLAMIKQLGIPLDFLTLSCSDL